MERAMNAIERLLDRVLLAMFAVMVAVTVWQVFARYVLQAPTIWSEELARFLMVWVTMLGSAYVIRTGEHVSVTVFIDLLPRRARLAVDFVRDGLTIALMGMLAWYGATFALLGARRISTGLNLPMTYAYFAIPAGAALIALFLLARRMTR